VKVRKRGSSPPGKKGREALLKRGRRGEASKWFVGKEGFGKGAKKKKPPPERGGIKNREVNFLCRGVKKGKGDQPFLMGKSTMAREGKRVTPAQRPSKS